MNKYVVLLSNITRPGAVQNHRMNIYIFSQLRIIAVLLEELYKVTNII